MYNRCSSVVEYISGKIFQGLVLYLFTLHNTFHIRLILQNNMQFNKRVKKKKIILFKNRSVRKIFKINNTTK